MPLLGVEHQTSEYTAFLIFNVYGYITDVPYDWYYRL